jgi:3-phenylpropionate/trans-cinnamate dioxygenase ferredoxin component
MTVKTAWIAACGTGDIEEDDVLRFDHGNSTFAIYHINGAFYASDGWCTHEKAHLADGFVLDDQIECPRHQGRFHIPSGRALCAPVCGHLKIYPIRIEGNQVMLDLSTAE